MKFKQIDEKELIGARVTHIDTQRTENVYPSVFLEKDGKTFEICGQVGDKVTVREVIERRGANGEQFVKDDYIEGTETIGIPGIDYGEYTVRGWVDSISEEMDMLSIQADDQYGGHRGTNVKLSTARRLGEKPRPILR